MALFRDTRIERGEPRRTPPPFDQDQAPYFDDLEARLDGPDRASRRPPTGCPVQPGQ